MELPEILQGTFLYMESQYGISFGLLIAPLSALILLIGVYILFFRKNQEISETAPGGKEQFDALEREMLVLNEVDRRNGLVSVGCTTCHLKTPHTHRERVTDYL